MFLFSTLKIWGKFVWANLSLETATFLASNIFFVSLGGGLTLHEMFECGEINKVKFQWNVTYTWCYGRTRKIWMQNKVTKKLHLKIQTLIYLYPFKARNLSQTEYFICHKGHWCLFCLLQAPYSIDTILLTPIRAHKIANNLQNVGMCCEFPVRAIKWVVFIIHLKNCL